MILSYHPLFVADENRLCAGRVPDREDRQAMRTAAAVILPQGCRQDLYEAARASCPLVFPNYDARFAYAGKTGQIRLFETTGTDHPQSFVFSDLANYRRWRRRNSPEQILGYPLVFKFDWGGEGETVFEVSSNAQLERQLERAAICERTGQRGFLLQKRIAAGSRSLRVVVVGRRLCAYWRVQPDAGVLWASLAGGAVIDAASDPDLQAAAIYAVQAFSRRTGINLAGFDLLIPEKDAEPRPLFLEINYFFGRGGLGGSAAYYRLLTAEIGRWLNSCGLSPAAGIREGDGD
jgi:ribosomal protein S6--L-glutamate ligase